MEKYIVSALVQNHYGVLARVSSLFGRRGFNIDSLTVSPTMDKEISRITLVAIGDEYTLDQILKQMKKLEECISVVHIDEEEAHCRELVLVKIHGDEATQESVREICDLYNAAIITTLNETIIVRKNGTPTDVDKFLSVLSNYEVVESSRTGITAMYKSEKSI
ncbi:MAG: acetolactate synthase small subunit [Eubacteriales bacterium]|nr:acetolactate synthase small subunit [Eubacteriales bacterium]